MASPEEQQPLIVDGGENVYNKKTISSIRCDQPLWKTRVSFIFILLAETAERFAFYGLLCNMALFLNSDPLLWASYNAIKAILIFYGISYFMTLVGGWMADSCLGKYWTVVFFFLFYIGGFIIWPFLHESGINPNCVNKTEAPSWCRKTPVNYTDNTNYIDITSEDVPLYDEQCSWAVFLSLAIIAFGYGGVRVNIVPFGAQQIEDRGAHSLRIYFNWLYWCINVGSFLAYLILGYVQQNVSYFYGYMIPLSFLIIAWIVFISGTSLYVKRKDSSGNPLGNVFKVIWSSIKHLCKKSSTPINFNSSPSEDFDEEQLSDPPPNPPVHTRGTMDRPPSCLDRASYSYGGDCPDQHVHNTKIFFKIFFIFVSLIPYWTVYYQMQTTFYIQGLHMRLDFNSTNQTIDDYENTKFKMPATWLSLFNILFVIILVPLLDRVIYPFLDSKQWSPTLRLRISCGMIFALVAMIVAGIVEYSRLKIYWGSDNVGYPHPQIIACTTYYASNMSIFWQIPQYLLLALSEVFTSIAGLELAYIYAPRSIQSIIMGMFYFSQGIGSILAIGIVSLTQGTWFSSYDYGNINCKTSPFKLLASFGFEDHPDKVENNCHLDYYFYTLAGVQTAGIMLFSLMSWCLDMGGAVPMRAQRIIAKPPSANANLRQRRSRESDEQMYYGT